jgi:hypothetical protein
MGRIPGRQDNPPRAPGEFVAKRIVIGLRSWQPAAVRHKAINMAPGALYPVDNLLGRHMIDAGVHPNLVEDNDPGFLGRLIQLPHGRADIGGRHHIFPLGNTFLGQSHMINIGQHTHRQVRLAHQFT